MAPRGFNISAPWRHWPDRDVSRRIPGQTLRHCHDACIAPDHGAQEQGGSRAPAQSPALRTLRRDAASGNGPAGAYAAWALLGGLGRPGWSGMYSQNPRGWKTGLAVFQRGAECAALLLSGRQQGPVVERRGAMWLAQGWARAGPASAGMCRSRRRAGRKEPVLVRSFLVRKIPTRRACSSFRHAVGFTRHVDPGLRSSARNGCSRRHWVGFRVRSGSGLAFRCRMR